MRKYKKIAIPIHAYELGKEDEKMEQWFASGMLRKSGDEYEVFTLESGTKRGQIVERGFYIKEDIKGNLYPSSKDQLNENYECIGDNLYVPKGMEVHVWFFGDNLCEEVLYLQEHKGLVLDEAHPETYFRAPLWGTVLSAAKDAALVFYSVERNQNGEIMDIDFNFVERMIFERTYTGAIDSH